MVMFEAYLRPGEILSLSPTIKFTRTCRERSSESINTTFPSKETHKHNWRSGRHDQPRLKTMSVNGTNFRKTSSTAAAGQAPAHHELRRVLPAVPSSPCKPADRCGTILRPSLWSFGGQGQKLANTAVHTQARTMEVGQDCAPLRKKRTGQPKLVRARSLGAGALRALQKTLDLSLASWSRLSDTAATASLLVLNLFVQTPICSDFS